MRTTRRTFLGGLSLVVPGVLAACSAPSGERTESTAGAPDFRITAYQGEDVLGGQTVNFSNVFVRGKPVILNFWAGLCPPCRAEMPGFQRVVDQFQDRLVLVGVDVGPFVRLGEHEDARRLLIELGIRYPAAYAVDSTPVRLYRVRSMPTTAFLTPSGQIAETVNGLLVESQMRAKVERLLAAA
jgi:cytochrome c biogenesis protein CcmG, thiol:disulfide interchange protein DsbE